MVRAGVKAVSTASPIKCASGHMTNPKPTRHPTAYAGGGCHRAAARLWASFARLQSLPDRLAWSLPSSYGRLAGPYSIFYYPKPHLGGGLQSWPWPTSWPPLGQPLSQAFRPASWLSLLATLLASVLAKLRGQTSWPNLLASLLASLLAKPFGQPLG